MDLTNCFPGGNPDKGYAINIEMSTLQNPYYRYVAYTSPNLMQLVLMNINPGEEVGMETHSSIDQFVRVESGQGEAIVNETTFVISDGSALIIPAGTKHNIINTSKHSNLKLYTIYTPPEHPNQWIEERKIL